MLKKAFITLGVLLLAGSLAAAVWTGWAGISGRSARAASAEDGCPPGYVKSLVLEPISSGEQGSLVVEQSCRPADEGVKTVVLEPLGPEEMRPSEYQPTETSPVVRGPSDSADYRCVVVLQPLEEGGAASLPVCGKGKIESVNDVSLNSLYLIAKFYDNTNYDSLLIEYYGQYPCSAGYSYGRPDLRVDGVDNRFASGRGFSSCDRITVYDGYNYTGPQYTCGPNCSTFYALNDAVSSWKVED